MGDDDNNSVDEIESAREETEREGPSEPEQPVKQSKGQQPKKQKQQQQQQPAAPSRIYPQLPKSSAQIDLLSQSPPTPPRTGQGSLNQVLLLLKQVKNQEMQKAGERVIRVGERK